MIEQNISLTAHESRQVRMRVKEKKKEIESRYKLISGTRKSTGVEEVEGKEIKSVICIRVALSKKCAREFTKIDQRDEKID